MGALAESIGARMKAKKRTPQAMADDEQEDDAAELTPPGKVVRTPPGGHGLGGGVSASEDGGVDDMGALDPGGDDIGEEDAELGDYGSIQDSAVADMMAAAKTGDAETFKAGLRDFVQSVIDGGEPE